jgi:hypothetical protein
MVLYSLIEGLVAIVIYSSDQMTRLFPYTQEIILTKNQRTQFYYCICCSLQPTGMSIR